ncbi:ferrous iron transport protein A [Elusimicrobiota bacterium]
MKYLTELKKDQTAEISKIEGGSSVHRKMELLGVRPGLKIKRENSNTLHGPVVISVGQSFNHVAIGYGMAQKIMVKI